MAYDDGKGLPLGSISVVILLGAAALGFSAMFFAMTADLIAWAPK